MSKTKKRTNLTIYAVVGVAAVLILMFVFPKLNKSQPARSLQGENGESNSSETATKSNTGLASPVIPVVNGQPQNFSLRITSPLNGSQLKTANIYVTGKSSPNADVFVNETDAKSDTQGNFSVSYNLEEGENYLVVGANDENGNFEDYEMTVTYEP